MGRKNRRRQKNTEQAIQALRKELLQNRGEYHWCAYCGRKLYPGQWHWIMTNSGSGSASATMSEPARRIAARNVKILSERR